MKTYKAIMVSASKNEVLWQTHVFGDDNDTAIDETEKFLKSFAEKFPINRLKWTANPLPETDDKFYYTYPIDKDRTVYLAETEIDIPIFQWYLPVIPDKNVKQNLNTYWAPNIVSDSPEERELPLKISVKRTGQKEYTFEIIQEREFNGIQIERVMYTACSQSESESTKKALELVNRYKKTGVMY